MMEFTTMCCTKAMLNLESRLGRAHSLDLFSGPFLLARPYVVAKYTYALHIFPGWKKTKFLALKNVQMGV